MTDPAWTRKQFAIRLIVAFLTGPVVALVGSTLESQFRRSHR